VVSELERDGVLACEPSPEDSRVKLLRPTPLALEVLVSRADAAFTEFAAVVNDTKKRLATADPT
jgi:hypothetical protein